MRPILSSVDGAEAGNNIMAFVNDRCLDEYKSTRLLGHSGRLQNVEDRRKRVVHIIHSDTHIKFPSMQHCCALLHQSNSTFENGFEPHKIS